MIQNYLTLQENVKDLDRIITSSSVQVQKIFCTAFYLYLQLRAPGKTLHVYIGKGKGHEGIYFSLNPPKPILRKTDILREYLRKHLSSCFLLSAEVDTCDRICSIKFQKMGQEHLICFFWKGRDCFFLHEYFDEKKQEKCLYCSWDGTHRKRMKTNFSIFSIFDELGRKEIERETKLKAYNFKEILNKEEKQALNSSVLKKKYKKLATKKSKITSDLKKIQEYKVLEEQIKSEYFIEELQGANAYKNQALKVKFPNGFNPYQKRDLLFKKIKSLKKAEKLQVDRLEKVEKELNTKTVSTENTLKSNIPIWNQGVRKVDSTNDEVFNEMIQSTFKMVIGNSALDNDRIRKTWAKKEDLWFHLENRPSTHIFIKPLDGFVLDDNFFQEIAKSFLGRMKIETDEVNLIYTQVKNIKGVKGRPGMVSYKKEKHRKVILDD